MQESLHYSILMQWSDEDQVYVVILPEWADRVLGSVSHGETYEDAIKHGQEALEALIASARQHGEALPQPRAYTKGT